MYYWTVSPAPFQQAGWWSCLSHSSLNISHLWFFLYINASTEIQTSLHTRLGISNPTWLCSQVPLQNIGLEMWPSFSLSHRAALICLLVVLQEFIAEFYNHHSLSSFPALQSVRFGYLTPVKTQTLSDRGLWNMMLQYSAVTHRCMFAGLFQHQPFNNFAPSTGSSCQSAESGM